MAKLNSKPQDNFDIKTCHKRMIGILDYIDRICSENNIKYFLYYGTLLGAVRHKGFIPWDDDADIALPRKEYDRLMEVLAKDNDPRYKLKSLANDPDWCFVMARVFDTKTKISLPYSKVLKETHVFVDIFPLDGCPNNDLFAKLHFKWMTFLTHMARNSDRTCFVDYEQKVWLKKLFLPLAKLFPARWWAEKADKLARSRDYDDLRYKYVTVGNADFLEGHTDRKDLTKAVRLDFENRQYNAPIGYINILNNLYTDYTQLPPVEKRVSNHLYTFIDLGDDD